MTELTPDAIKTLTATAEAELAAVRTAVDLEAWRVRYLGRKGQIPLLLRQVKELPVADRHSLGKAANELRQKITAAYQERQEGMAAEGAARPEPELQPKTYNLKPSQGHLHPLTHTMRRVSAILSDLGFREVEGPLVEDPFFDFDALNMPPEHPARAETDTFYLTDGHVLRTSTSAVQVRAVREMQLQPPFKIFSPGRVFRSEKIDPTHSHTFHQVEALSLGEDVTVADYLGVTRELFSRFFNTDVKVRLRPGYFPFVEPGFEPDISCAFCGGTGCRICKGSGWIEIGGAGMVHPNVLGHMGFDADATQGFAFGYGLERLAMLAHNINDIRLFMSGELEFLRQF